MSAHAPQRSPDADARAADRLVVELVGPAGAGKTTLLRALRERDARVRAGVPTRTVQHLPRFVRDVLPMLPGLARPARGGRRLGRAEIRSIVYVGAWLATLEHGAGADRGWIVFDHGPVFRLASLREFGPELVHGAAFRAWWERSLGRWIRTLDRVVLLDAPDEVLLERVEARGRSHRIRGQDARVACAFLARYRSAYDAIARRMEVAGGPAVLRLDAREPVARLVDRIVDGLAPGRARHDPSGARP